ncbi:MAG: DUF4093 domain-containing protein [Oscillospiraceae bacterium]|nr:DUF4093 domain-containing protein [Oscillospiraceae bacterium]
MYRIKEVIVVEGRYDKNTLRQVVEATVVCTDGFGIFRDREKQALLRALAEKRGLVVLTDSDGAGKRIRGFLSGIADPKQIKHAYIPDVPGRERRKSAPSKEGTLGVEGLRPEILLEALRRAGASFEDAPPAEKRSGLSAAALYRLGLSGGPESAEKRRALQKRLGFPARMSAKQLREALENLYAPEELEALLQPVQQKGQTDDPQHQHAGGAFQQQLGQGAAVRVPAAEGEEQTGAQEHNAGEYQHTL